MLQHNWPGNVRELENVIERSVVMAEKDMLVHDTLPHKLLNDKKKCHSLEDIFSGFSIKTGKEIWKVKTGGSVCFPPVFNNGLGYAQSHDRNLYIFDLQDGAIKDTIRGDYWMCGVPSIANKHVYYPDWGGNLSSYDLKERKNEWYHWLLLKILIII